MENLAKDNNDQGEKDSTMAVFTECIIRGCSNQCKNESNNEELNHELEDGMGRESSPGTLSNGDDGEKPGGNWEENREEVPRLEVGEETELTPLVSHNLEDGSVQDKSNEKKRLLEAAGDGNDNDSTRNHGYDSQKKYKQGECSSAEPEFGLAVSPLECSNDLSNVTDGKCGSRKKEGSASGSSGKRQRDEWEPQAQANEESIDDTARSGKRRKSRWLNADMQMKLLGPLQLPNLTDQSVLEFDVDPEILGLKTELADIDDKLEKPVLVDERRKEEQSPSPDPIYNDMGIRINTREVRLREKLIRKRHGIISDLIKKHPTFKPRPSYKPSKLLKKLYIPVKQYPEYDFVGSILGYRGDNQKRMEKETGARISLRGAGSSRKRKHVSNNDDLHVLIEADDENSLDAAVRMVEKLLVPVKNSRHKRAKLGEIAVGNAGTNGYTRSLVSPASPPVLIENETHLPGSQNFTLTLSPSVPSLSDISGASSFSSFSSYSDWFAFSSHSILSQPHIGADYLGFQFALSCRSPSALQIPPIDSSHTPEGSVKHIVWPTDHTHCRTQ